MANSTKPAHPRTDRESKPNKPYPEFLLFPHATKRWAKKIRGKMHYFGPWEDPDGALQKYQDQRDDPQAGRTPHGTGNELTVRDLANRFMKHQQRSLANGEIKERTWDELHAPCERLVKTFGVNRIVSDLASEDFERLRASIAEIWGAVRLGNEVQRIRSVFKYGYESGLIESPVRFGPAFKRPARKVLRKLRAEQGVRMFEANEIQRMLKSAGVQLKAMILLGINCGFGNEDVATLPIKALDLDAGWARFARPKTGIDRKCKLWPETVKAMRDVLADRRAPDDAAYADRVFITKYGKPWANGTYGTAVTHEMGKLLVELGIKRPRLSFYTLRHAFETIAGESKDQVAVDAIMGHARDDMASAYRERISDERLIAVSEHVRTWLMQGKAKTKGKSRQASDE